MVQIKKKLDINVLLQHLKIYKDAVIILGPDIAKGLNAPMVTEESKEYYNRKNMVRKPSVFWDFYSDNFMQPIDYNTEAIKQVNKFLKLGLHTAIIDTNIINFIKNEPVIHPNGRTDILTCVKCGTEYSAKALHEKNEFYNRGYSLKCDECQGNIKPTVLYYGEKYSQLMYNQVKNAIFTEENNRVTLNTHTLIFIGVDFTDSLVAELLDSYDALKTVNHFTVIISDRQYREDVIFNNPEFGVCDDIEKGLERLINLIEKE